MVIPINKEEFIKKVYDLNSTNPFEYIGDVPCVIDFWAPWCGPCKAISPVLEELSDEYKLTVNFYKINVDEEEELSAIFNISSIPTLYFITKDKTPSVVQGAVGKEKLKSIINDLFK